MLLLVQVGDAPDLLRILEAGLLAVHVSDGIDPEQSFEVVAASVEDVERVLFIRDDVHRIHIVDPGFRDVEERWDGGLKVVQRMYFDSAFPLVFPEDGPFECIQAKLDSR